MISYRSDREIEAARERGIRHRAGTAGTAGTGVLTRRLVVDYCRVTAAL